MMQERARAGDVIVANVAQMHALIDALFVTGRFHAQHWRPRKSGALRLLWEDDAPNQVMQQGAEAMLTHAFKGSTYTAVMAMGLIESTGYSSIARTNTAANITAAGGGSPTNGWNEATSAMFAARLTPSFGTAGSSGANSDLATSATVDFTAAASATIKGCFLLMRSAGGTAPTTTVGNTAGALWSAGLFSVDRVVAASDQIKVTYTGRLTT